MKGVFTAAPFTAALGATAAFASALAPRAKTPPVVVKGNAFYAGNERFYIKGVDYQPGGSSDAADPIADETICKRDIEQFKKLGINTVRIYTIDNSKDHTACMNALADAGIYLALDVNTPHYSIRQDKPGPSYNTPYLQNIFATVDEFSKFDNTLLFFSGNEVINNVPTSKAAPWVKAVTRDIKQYIGNRKYRPIPVGYSAADIDDNRVETAHYMNCGTDDERSDFFAFNDYSWCAPSSFTTSTWSQKVDSFKDYSIPIFLSEYGCTKTARTWEEIPTLYSDKMSSVYSGGLVYEYTKEGDAVQQKFGLVEVESDSEVTERPDFGTLKTALAKASPPAGNGGAKSSGSPSKCPTRSDTWLVSDDKLPKMPENAKKFFKDGAGDGVGLDGPGSQDLGDESGGFATPGSGAPTATGSVTGSSTGSSSSSGTSAATAVRIPPFSFAPLVCGMVLLASSLLGGAMLL